ncbi:replication initiator [Asanoa iriomotensis]|nr:replication initiator [Asanoa iriomotensis]
MAPPWYVRSTDVRLQAIARAVRDDYPDWLDHVRSAAACVRPVRLAGAIATVEADTGRILSTVSTATMPDGVIYKACGNRRETVCPACSQRYKGDAYQVVRSGLIGGKGVPEQVATHPAVFPTFTAPSFGPVHTRHIKRHTCGRRASCDCRPEPCHPRRDAAWCEHGRRLVCFARHADSDRALGTPLCLDCYDHDAQVVWNLQAGELWRRTTIAINRYMRRLARERGIPDVQVVTVRDGKVRVRSVAPFRLSFGKAAEMQRRAAVHFHAIIRLDGFDPDDRDAILPPPAGLDAGDLKAAVDHAAGTVGFTTGDHPARPEGWPIAWGPQTLTKLITVAADGEVTDGMVAAYLAKYATKSTEITGHASSRLNDDTIGVYADPDGTHTERLVEACWILGRPSDWRRLRRWAHMLGFGGHFLTKSRRYSVTFTVLRAERATWQRVQNSGPEVTEPGEEPTTLVVNFLQFVGAGWHTTADALMANTSAALAREHQQLARTDLVALAA